MDENLLNPEIVGADWRTSNEVSRSNIEAGAKAFFGFMQKVQVEDTITEDIMTWEELEDCERDALRNVSWLVLGAALEASYEEHMREQSEHIDLMEGVK